MLEAEERRAIQEVRAATGCGVTDVLQALRMSDWDVEIARLRLTEGMWPRAERLLAERRALAAAQDPA